MVSKFSTTDNSTRAVAANPTIVKKFSLSSYSNGKQIPLYEVSLNEGDDAGYAIVSGDERVPGVIAYVEHGSLNDTLTNKGAAMMLKEAQRSLISKVKAVDISNLFYHVAHGIQTTWSNGEGGAKISNASSYLSGLGITFDSGSKWAGYSMDAGRIVESLDKLYPVIITGAYEAGTRSSSVGGRHCWILDGYQIRRRTTTTRTVVKQNDTYNHANFGWSGSEDGYYMVDRNTTNLNFETSYNGHYNQDLKLYPNVRKK